MTNGEIVRRAIQRVSNRKMLGLSTAETHLVSLEIFKELAAYNKTIVPYSMLEHKEDYDCFGQPT